jgi:hypothetical protein
VGTVQVGVMDPTRDSTAISYLNTFRMAPSSGHSTPLVVPLRFRGISFGHRGVPDFDKIPHTLQKHRALGRLGYRTSIVILGADSLLADPMDSTLSTPFALNGKIITNPASRLCPPSSVSPEIGSKQCVGCLFPSLP